MPFRACAVKTRSAAVLASHNAQSRFAGRPWAIAPARLEGLLANVAAFTAGSELPPWLQDANRSPGYAVTESGIAVVPVLGPLVARADGLTALLGAGEYGDVVETLSAAAGQTEVPSDLPHAPTDADAPALLSPMPVPDAYAIADRLRAEFSEIATVAAQAARLGIAIDAADPNLGRDAVFRAGGVDPGIPVRVILRRPDRVGEFGETRIVAGTVVIDVRISEVAAPTDGDSIEFDGTVYVIQDEPIRDAERLVWTIEARLA